MLSIRSTNGSDFHTVFHQCRSDLRGGILHGGAVSAIRNHVTDGWSRFADESMDHLQGKDHKAVARGGHEGCAMEELE